MKTKISFSFLIALFVFQPGRASSQTNAMLSDVRVNWHLAGVSEAASDWGSALDYFEQVVDKAQYLPLMTREWYRCMGWLGVAKTSARLRDTTAARTALAQAFNHQFRNATLLEEDVRFTGVVGKSFIDSLDAFWIHVQQLNSTTWSKQEPIVFRPHDAAPGQPLIIALHGGNDNYQTFATYWSDLADRAHATIVVPAGCIRNSETENSWEYDIAAIEPKILELRTEYVQHFEADPHKVYLAGFSQGAQASLALTLLHPALFQGALAFSGFLFSQLSDSVLSVAAQHHPRIYALSGEWDIREFLSHLDTIHARCLQHGIAFDSETEKAMAHEMPLDFQQRFDEAWRWVSEPERTERERTQRERSDREHAAGSTGQ